MPESSPSSLEIACILAVGTELSSGQVTNTNASWISSHLTALGLKDCFHITVADDRQAILRALRQAEPFCDLLIVTGGLGPTTDDFTRDVIAAWLGKPLELVPDSLHRLEQWALRQEIKLSQAQKQQCYFPAQARVVANPVGTADAFICSYQSKPVVVLPGPPTEIKAIWEDSLKTWFENLLPGQPFQQLLRWQCLGLPEAEIGEKVEAVLAGSGLQTGYRVHAPYVEVKVWSPVAASRWLEAVEQVLAPWVMARNNEELASDFIQQLCRFPEIRIIDSATGGLLQQRLQPFLASDMSIPPVSIFTSYRPLAEKQIADISSDRLTLVLESHSEQEWQVSILYRERSLQTSLNLPLKPGRKINSQRWGVEKALKCWQSWLFDLDPLSS